MRSRLLTVWATILLAALGAIVQGRRAALAGESEGSPFAKLYARAGSGQGPRTTETRDEAKKLYREGKVAATEDLFQLASLLSTSDVPQDLLLAHDCALVALLEGFRPSLRTLKTSQRRLLRTIGHSSVKETHPMDALPSAGVLDHLERTWSQAVRGFSKSRPSSVTLAVVD